MNTTSTNEKSSEKLIEYVETLILAGKLKVDDRLPPERNLAEAVINGDLEMGKEALDQHFVFITKDINT